MYHPPQRLTKVSDADKKPQYGTWDYQVKCVERIIECLTELHGQENSDQEKLQHGNLSVEQYRRDALSVEQGELKQVIALLDSGHEIFKHGLDIEFFHFIARIVQDRQLCRISILGDSHANLTPINLKRLTRGRDDNLIDGLKSGFKNPVDPPPRQLSMYEQFYG